MKKSAVVVNNNSRSKLSSFKLQEYERPGISSDEILEIKESFDLFDVHHSGFVKPTGTDIINEELQASLLSLGSDCKNQPIYQMISDLVEEDVHEIDFNQFLDLMTARVSTKDTKEDMRKVFNLFDEGKSGFISLNSLKRVIKELGENVDEHELQEMIEKADQDHDGLVSEEEFYNIMTKKNLKHIE